LFFRPDYFDGDLFGRLYDVAKDGRFLMLKAQSPPLDTLVIVLNWFDELAALAPSP
jgi:hypothetical protein